MLLTVKYVNAQSYGNVPWITVIPPSKEWTKGWISCILKDTSFEGVEKMGDYGMLKSGTIQERDCTVVQRRMGETREKRLIKTIKGYGFGIHTLLHYVNSSRKRFGSFCFSLSERFALSVFMQR